MVFFIENPGLPGNNRELIKMKIVIAGATGFVGQCLIEALSPDHQIIGLRRSAPEPTASSTPDLTQLEKSPDPSTPSGPKTLNKNVEWRQCDLFSLLQTEDALQGADVGIYLVHSMLPTAKLSQSHFEDLDLLLADNFSRAAEKCGLKRILYLGGLIPDAKNLSRHLTSRLEVEHALSSRKVPLTTLRSGLILGANGSSFQILYLLVRRLPILICPKWVWMLTQSIAIDDVVSLIRFCLSDARTIGQTYDIGGPDIVSYRDLMNEVAIQLHLKRRFINVPYFSVGLSGFWVRLITGASRSLVSPLIQSLRHRMVLRNPKLLELYGKPLMRLKEALAKCLKSAQPSLRATTRQRVLKMGRKKDVRSIQRLSLPPGKDARWIANEYFRWLPSFLNPLILVTEKEPGIWDFRLRGLNISFLILSHSPERSSADRQIFYISGGVLVTLGSSPRGRLEFRQVLKDEYILAAIHDFYPRLSWLIYKYTQAIIHLWVMHNFGKHLRRCCGPASVPVIP